MGKPPLHHGRRGRGDGGDGEGLVGDSGGGEWGWGWGGAEPNKVSGAGQMIL